MFLLLFLHLPLLLSPLPGGPQSDGLTLARGQDLAPTQDQGQDLILQEDEVLAGTKTGAEKGAEIETEETIEKGTAIETKDETQETAEIGTETERREEMEEGTETAGETGEESTLDTKQERKEHGVAVSVSSYLACEWLESYCADHSVERTTATTRKKQLLVRKTIPQPRRVGKV
jgi:hypothetical protein